LRTFIMNSGKNRHSVTWAGWDELHFDGGFWEKCVIIRTLLPGRMVAEAGRMRKSIASHGLKGARRSGQAKK